MKSYDCGLSWISLNLKTLHILVDVGFCLKRTTKQGYEIKTLVHMSDLFVSIRRTIVNPFTLTWTQLIKLTNIFTFLFAVKYFK